MPNHAGLDGGDWGYEDDPARANAAEFGDEAAPIILSAIADSIAGSATDAEEALDMCRDFANSEDLDAEQYAALVALVESQTGWEMPDDSDTF